MNIFKKLINYFTQNQANLLNIMNIIDLQLTFAAQVFIIFETNNITNMKPALKVKNKSNTKQATPIVLIDQSDPNQNATLISKMMGLATSKIVPQQPFKKQPQSNFHGGGFNLNNNSSYTANVNNNYEQTLSKLSYQNPSYIQPPIQPTHLYEQLGISTTSGIKGNRKSSQNYKKSKYRQDDQPGQVVLSKIDREIEQMNDQRRQKFKNMKIDNWTYKIADQPKRQQSAVHVQSSLQQLNLQNVQAKLQAHRMKMRQVQEEYHKKVGKVFDPSSRYLDNPKLQNQNTGLKFNIDVDKDFAQLEAQKGRIYELAKQRQNKQPQQIDLDQLWQQKKLKNPKLAEYDTKYKEYLLQKQARGLISCAVRQRLFTWDKYIQPGHKKKKAPFHGVASLHRDRKSKSKQKNDVDSPTKQQKVSQYGNINDLGQVLATKNDQFIASYIMAQIDKQKRGLVSKQELYEYIKTNEKILRGYNIDMKWLFTDLDNYETNRKGMLSKVQIAKFLALLEKVMHPQMKIRQKDNKIQLDQQFQSNRKKDSAYTTTFPKNKYLFEKLFIALDLGDDKLIKRQQFIDNIYTDSQINQIIDKEAINISIIGKTITYRQIIGAILDDYRNQKNQKIKKSKEYITFGRFCQYFQIPQSLDLRKLQRHRKKQRNESALNQQQIMDLSSEYLQIMKDIAATIPRVYQDYITSVDFIQTCLRDPQILAFSQQLCRIQSVQTKLPIESIQATLTRMLKQCDQYSTWDELKMFLSRRGRPLNWDFQVILKKKAIRQSKIKQHGKNVSASKLFNKTLHATDVVLDTLRDTRKSLSKQKIKYGHYDKYTIPKPFNITDQHKQKQGKRKSVQKPNQLEQLRGKFKANPVNKQILQPKPQLIQGKIAKKDDQSKPDYYKYQNYENDRIQRALKKAQEKFELEQQIRATKQQAQVKARSIGIDLTKKYNDVIKQQQKKKRQQSQKKKPTNPSVSKNLYPDDPATLMKRKLQKAQQNMQKANQIAKKKQQLERQQRQRLKAKNKQIQQHVKRKKKQEDEQNKIRQNINKPDFKPKINKRQLSQAQKAAIQHTREEKQRKKKQTQQKILQAQQERKKKVLAHQTKDKKLEIKDLDAEEILERINQVDLEDLLLDQAQKQQFRKQIKVNVNKVKQMKQKYEGMAGRQRAALENQERRIMEQKKRLKQKKQAQKTAGKKETFSTTSQKGEKSGQRGDLDFHKSKALRRYRAIMQGKQPLSQFDKYSIHNNIQKNEMEI